MFLAVNVFFPFFSLLPSSLPSSSIFSHLWLAIRSRKLRYSHVVDRFLLGVELFQEDDSLFFSRVGIVVVVLAVVALAVVAVVLLFGKEAVYARKIELGLFSDRAGIELRRRDLAAVHDNRTRKAKQPDVQIIDSSHSISRNFSQGICSKRMGKEAVKEEITRTGKVEEQQPQGSEESERNGVGV
jgi:hypothetical protein